MATNLIALPPPPKPPRLRHLQPKPVSCLLPSSFGGKRCDNKKLNRLKEVVVRAGPPSTSSLVFAFVLPLSLIAGTVLASIRVADKLDEQYLEELAMNKAVLEEQEGEGEEEEEVGFDVDRDGNIVLGDENEVAASVVPRARNRPRREA